MSDPRKFKNDIVVEGDINLPSEAPSRALIIDATGDIASSPVTDTELSYLDGVTSPIQTQIDDITADLAGFVKADGTVPMTGDFNLAGNDIINAADISGTSVTVNDVADTHATFTPTSIQLKSEASGDPSISSVLNMSSSMFTAGASNGAVSTAIQVVSAGGAIDFSDTTDPDNIINSNITVSAAGVSLTGTVNANNNLITNVATPVSDSDAATKKYVDDSIAAIPDPFFYAGTYDANTNTPDLDLVGARISGAVYYVTVAGTHNFGAFGGTITLDVGDKIVYNGNTSTWDKWDHTDAVTSVNGQIGVVVLDSDDVAEGITNLYFTDERAQDAVGTILVDSDTVDFTYMDATPSITAAVKTQMSITSDASGVKLVGDASTPGNTQYYGTDGAGVKGFHSIPASGSPGDIQQTSFSAADSVVAPANVTGFAFANASVRAFSALVSVSIDGTSDLFEEFHIQGIQKTASWNISVDSVGDNSGITFSITSAGQIQYTSGTVPGFVSNTIKFRAIVVNI